MLRYTEKIQQERILVDDLSVRVLRRLGQTVTVWALKLHTSRDYQTIANHDGSHSINPANHYLSTQLWT